MNKKEIFVKIQEILVETFDMNDADIKMESNIFEDLDLDSIDAVDLMVSIQEITGKKIDPQVFKTVRTIENVVDAIAELLDGSSISK